MQLIDMVPWEWNGVKGMTSMQGYSIGWGTLALINAGLAQSKKKSGLQWFFISLFLGPLATLLLVAWYPNN
jgi:uncharacterized membrane protein